jgi:hypothetical protein
MRKYWWTYLVYINNLHPSIRNQGMIWGSFFALEVQLFIAFLPFVGMLLYNRRLAILAILSIMIGTMAAGFSWAITKDVTLSPLDDPYEAMRYEQKPWNKGFPYGFGILIGYLYWVHRNEENEGTWLQRF